jgi:peptidoglycan/LPS O-acetylase OafA/YrhL
MYIWAFPVQQMIIYTGVRNQWVLMVLAVPAAYVCGILSWTFIEEPTQRLRRYLRPSATMPRSVSGGGLRRVPAAARE